jgi:hypothetical protein
MPARFRIILRCTSLALALDAYVAKAYWNLDPPALPFLRMAEQRGLGSLQFDKLHTQIAAINS